MDRHMDGWMDGSVWMDGWVVHPYGWMHRPSTRTDGWTIPSPGTRNDFQVWAGLPRGKLTLPNLRYTYIYIYVYICIRKCVYVYIYIYIYIYIYLSVYIYIGVYIYICIERERERERGRERKREREIYTPPAPPRRTNGRAGTLGPCAACPAAIIMNSY